MCRWALERGRGRGEPPAACGSCQPWPSFFSPQHGTRTLRVKHHGPARLGAPRASSPRNQRPPPAPHPSTPALQGRTLEAPGEGLPPEPPHTANLCGCPPRWTRCFSPRSRLPHAAVSSHYTPSSLPASAVVVVFYHFKELPGLPMHFLSPAVKRPYLVFNRLS